LSTSRLLLGAALVCALAATYACKQSPGSKQEAAPESAKPAKATPPAPKPAPAAPAMPATPPGASLPGAPAAPPAPALPPDAVAVRVDGLEVKNKEIDDAMSSLARRMRAPVAMLPPAVKAKLRTDAQDHVVTGILLKRHAESQGFKATPEEARKSYDDLLKRLPPGSTEADLPKLVGASKETVQSDLADSATMKKLFESFEAKAKPTDAAIQAHYDANKDKYTTKAQASASHVLLRVPKDAPEAEVAKVKAKADSIVIKARAGDAKAFAALADAESDDPSAKRNHGDMGFFEDGRMVPEFSAAAFALKEGEISAPVKTRFGWHVLRGQGQRAAGLRPLAEVKEEISTTIMRETVGKQIEALTAELKAKAKIEVVAQ